MPFPLCNLENHPLACLFWIRELIPSRNDGYWLTGFGFHVKSPPNQARESANFGERTCCRDSFSRYSHPSSPFEFSAFWLHYGRGAGVRCMPQSVSRREFSRDALFRNRHRDMGRPALKEPVETICLRERRAGRHDAILTFGGENRDRFIGFDGTEIL